MIWLAMAALALVAIVLPLALVLRRGAAPRARREAALALHRQQLAELDTEVAEGRLPQAEHQGAVLEVQRRLLQADADTEAGAGQGASGPLVLSMALVPLLAVLLYLVHGAPGLPDAPLAARLTEAQRRQTEEDTLIAQLRARLAQLDPKSDQARQGFVLLGSFEETRGRWAGAAEAWQRALGVRFDATLAARTAEAIARAAGRVTPEAAALFRRALAAAPADAPWRGLVEQRLSEAPPS